MYNRPADFNRLSSTLHPELRTRSEIELIRVQSFRGKKGKKIKGADPEPMIRIRVVQQEKDPICFKTGSRSNNFTRVSPDPKLGDVLF